MEQISTFEKGMSRDIHPRNQPKGNYRDALNGMLLTESGEQTAFSNEKGNEICGELPQGYKVIGSINTDSNEIIIFSTDNIYSEVGIYDPTCCKYETVVNTTCLGFDTCNPIHGVFKVRNGCDRIIYFTDGVNPVRVIDLDNLQDYLDSENLYDCSLMTLTLPVRFATLDTQVNNSGGSLLLGAYQIAHRYGDSSGNYTNWSIVSTPIMITDDDINSNWQSIDGGQNIDYFTAEEGGLPTSSKSITITYNNIDERYDELEIAVLRSNEGLSSITAIDKLKTLDIRSDSISITYGGDANNVIDSLELTDVLVDNEDIQVAETLTQLDHSLWLGNIRTSTYDYGSFQREALNIVATPTVRRQNHLFPGNEGNSKNPKPFSYMGDEVYSLGIVYVFNNGTKTPVFHIPGREGTEDDRLIVNTWVPDIAHIVGEDEFNSSYAKTEEELAQNPEKFVVRRYEAFETSSNDGELIAGYYENKESVYPDTVSCDGESIWGDLVGSPVRHFRMPSRRVLPIMNKLGDSFVTNVLGITFSNINYPHPDIVGHYFVRANREGNKTIQDTGVWLGTADGLGRRHYYDFLDTPTPGEATVIHSPKLLSDKKLTNSNYIKLLATQDVGTAATSTTFPTPSILAANIQIDSWYMSGYYEEQEPPTTGRTNFAIGSSIIVDRSSTQSAFDDFEIDLINESFSDSAAFYNMTEESANDHENLGKHHIISLKNSADVYANIFNLEYFPISDNIQYGNNSQTIFTGADTVISPLAASVLSPSLLDHHYTAYSYEGYFIESEYNWGLRHKGTSTCNDYFNAEEDRTLWDFYILRIADLTEGGDYLEKENPADVCEEYYGYNKDFSKTNIESINTVLGNNYDYCSKCLNYYPNRIYYSRRDDLESRGDNYRTFLANNYRTLDTSGDSITRLITDKSQLYCFTTSYAYFVPTRTQELKTDEDSVYIGTGARLSVPPSRLVSTDYKYGGTTNKHSMVSTHYGVFYADSKSGKVFKLGESLAEISNKGMGQFFEENLSSEFLDLYRKGMGEDYWCIDSTVDSKGVGIKGVFDPRFYRYILTKKDYKIKSPYNKFLPYDSEIFDYTAIYVNTDTKKFYIHRPLTGLVEVQLTSNDIFEEVEWTISYNVAAQAWSSFHSYIPEWSFNDHNNFYSSIDNSIYQHNQGEFNTYYGQKYPFFVEFTLNEGAVANKTLNSIYIVNDSFEGDSYVDKTFNKAWLYNNRQSTGQLNLVPQTSDTFDPYINMSDTIGVREIKDKYYFNGMRSRLEGLPSFEEGTAHRSPVNIGDVNPFNLARLKGDYINVRLTSDEILNYRINTHSVISKYNNSNR